MQCEKEESMNCSQEEEEVLLIRDDINDTRPATLGIKMTAYRGKVYYHPN